jgi:hypothetical protein
MMISLFCSVLDWLEVPPAPFAAAKVLKRPCRNSSKDELLIQINKSSLLELQQLIHINNSSLLELQQRIPLNNSSLPELRQEVLLNN